MCVLCCVEMPCYCTTKGRPCSTQAHRCACTTCIIPLLCLMMSGYGCSMVSMPKIYNSLLLSAPIHLGCCSLDHRGRASGKACLQGPLQARHGRYTCDVAAQADTQACAHPATRQILLSILDDRWQAKHVHVPASAWRMQTCWQHALLHFVLLYTLAALHNVLASLTYHVAALAIHTTLYCPHATRY